MAIRAKSSKNSSACSCVMKSSSCGLIIPQRDLSYTARLACLQWRKAMKSTFLASYLPFPNSFLCWKYECWIFPCSLNFSVSICVSATVARQQSSVKSTAYPNLFTHRSKISKLMLWMSSYYSILAMKCSVSLYATASEAPGRTSSAALHKLPL